MTAQDAQRTDEEARIDPARLRYQLARRGQNLAALSRGPNRLNPSTVGKLNRGARISELHPSTLVTLMRWMAEHAPVPALDGMIQPPKGVDVADRDALTTGAA